jgi:hypothetical protein
VEKTIGDKVTGGTINGTGSFVRRAEQVDKNYIHKPGQDLSDIRDWKWRLARADKRSRGRPRRRDELQRRLHPRPAAQDGRALPARTLGRTVKERSGPP